MPKGQSASAVARKDTSTCSVIYTYGPASNFGKEHDRAGAVAPVRRALESVTAFEPAALEQELKAFVAERNMKVGQFVHPLRFAATGRSVGLGLYDALAILGRERSLMRIRRAASAAG